MGTCIFLALFRKPGGQYWVLEQINNEVEGKKAGVGELERHESRWLLLAGDTIKKSIYF